MSAKILVVDDNKLNTRLLTQILTDEGYEVSSVNNGHDAVNAAHQVKSDIILLDIMMPEIDGFEVCRLLKIDSELRDVPVIMVTAKTDGLDVKRALELGAFDYIKKPVDEWEVIARVQSALRFKHYQDSLKEMAMKDGLTGLYNHTLLIELLDKELAKQGRCGADICFAMVDIDYFKEINDTQGHQAGDIILKELSNIMTTSLRKSDIVGRYGGEEFGIILPGINCIDAYRLCERLRNKIETHEFKIHDLPAHITVSIGICYKNSVETANSGQMIKRADDALYTAKKGGRNKVEVSIEQNAVLNKIIEDHCIRL